jgi:hypothetical protein
MNILATAFATSLLGVGLAAGFATNATVNSVAQSTPAAYVEAPLAPACLVDAAGWTKSPRLSGLGYYTVVDCLKWRPVTPFL